MIDLSIGRGQSHTYSYIGTDFPPRHPSLHLEPASMTLQESIRYGANSSDAITSEEWATLKEYPEGRGRALLGSNHRELLITFYHQLHCIREVQMGLFDRDDTEATPHHMKHCLDYLRQTILCSAEDSLEEGDFLTRDHETQRTGGDLLCWDWEAIFKDLDNDWLAFLEGRDDRI